LFKRAAKRVRKDAARLGIGPAPGDERGPTSPSRPWGGKELMGRVRIWESTLTKGKKGTKEVRRSTWPPPWEESRTLF